MASRVRVKFQSNLSAWTAVEEKKLDIVALSMATDIHREASINAPVDKGNLVASGRIEKKKPASYDVSFGGNSGGVSVPYARIHELGGQTGRNHAVTIKAKHYLEKAGKSVAKKKSKYLKGLK